MLGGLSGVITLKEKQEIIKLHLEDVSEREIARRTNKARNTVRKYINEGKKSILESTNEKNLD